MSDHHDDHTHSHHITGLVTLFATFAALVVLTVLTVAQARWDALTEIVGTAEIYVTLLIATVKASLVALVFMQLAHDKPFNVIVVISALLFMALFLGFCLVDSAEYFPQVRDFRFDNVRADP